MINTISILGCGWLGMPLGKFLSQKRYQVKGSTTSTGKLRQINQAGMEGYCFDLADAQTDNLREFLDTDVLIITLPPSIQYYEQIITKLLRTIEENALKRVIFINSTAVYPNLNRRVTEDDAENILSRSGVALLAVENLFSSNNNFETTILRFAGLYGPGREPGMFLSGKAGLSGAKAPVNLVHLDDCLGVIYSVLKMKIWGETFNVCAPGHPERQLFYSKACDTLGVMPPHFISDKAPFKVVDATKLTKSLAYQFIHPDPMEDL